MDQPKTLCFKILSKKSKLMSLSAETILQNIIFCNISTQQRFKGNTLAPTMFRRVPTHYSFFGIQQTVLFICEPAGHWIFFSLTLSDEFSHAITDFPLGI